MAISSNGECDIDYHLLTYDFSWCELIWDRVRTKLVLADMPLRLEDRLADIAFGSVSASLYCTYTVQVTAMLGDMGDFFANKKFGEISL